MTGTFRSGIKDIMNIIIIVLIVIVLTVCSQQFFESKLDDHLIEGHPN
uniref:Uncharacterized protein n=1 Tax=Lepeophtheirus salmonis TaxID=72036 RepID=A0A0K2TK40_LEPSM